MKKIIIIGSRGHAHAVISACEAMMEFKIIGLVDDFRSEGEKEGKYTVLGKLSDIKDLNWEHDPYFFIAVGDNYQRKKIYEGLWRLDLKYANIIHPFSCTSDAKLGEGIVVMPGAVINSGCTISNFCILNTHSSIDHDSVMGNFSSIAPNVSTGGNVNIGELTAVGLGASIKNKITIGKNNVIGCGALVLKDIGDNTVSYGFPCKYIKERAEGEKYL